MNIARVLRLVAAFGAVLAAAVVCVVAAAFAVYAAAREVIGPAWAAAVVAAVFALLAILVAWGATRKANPRAVGGAPPPPPTSLLDRAISIAKERPLIALGAAAAVATLAIRNPAVISAAVSAFLAGSASKPTK